MTIPTAAPLVATDFFRMPRVWDVVCNEVNDLEEDPIIWSGACATGQEPYSAAILADEQGWNARIIATDINPDCIEYARAGRYPADRIGADLTSDRLQMRQIEDYFEIVEDGDTMVVVDGIRAAVEFDELELGVDTPPACHVALVRNVWRHIAPEGQRLLAEQIHETLLPGGILVLGGADLHSEAIWQRTGKLVEQLPPGLKDLFEESAEHEVIWRPR